MYFKYFYAKLKMFMVSFYLSAHFIFMSITNCSNINMFIKNCCDRYIYSIRLFYKATKKNLDVLQFMAGYLSKGILVVANYFKSNETDMLMDFAVSCSK